MYLNTNNFRSNRATSQADKWPNNLTFEEKRLQFDSFRSEARTRATSGKLDQAVEMYDKALILNSDDTQCLVARATCHLRLGDYDKAVNDADVALKVNNKQPKANYIKAEALYQMGEFEQALVYYHRAKRLRPGAPEYDRGIKKAEGAVENTIGDSVGTRLDTTGDLTYFDQQKAPDDRSVALLARQTSAQHRKTIAMEHEARRIRNKNKDAKTVKQLLGSLFGDWKYLENLLKDEEHILEEMNEEAKMEEQRRKRLIKEKKELLRGNNHSRQMEEDDDKLVPPNRFSEDVRKMKRGFSHHIHALSERELSYLYDRTDFWLQQKAPSEDKKPVRSGTNRHKGKKRPIASARQLVAKLQEIEQAQHEGRHEESLQEAERLLKQLEVVSDGEVNNRSALVASLHSLAGNAYIEMGDFRSALRHHALDLNISEQKNLAEGRSRALDNVARVHAKRGDYHSAIHTFRKKMALISDDLEATWLHHELGRCYLEVKQFDKAYVCAETALNAAQKTDDRAWLLNAQVLLAQSSMEMGDLTTSLDAFEDALETAKTDNDSAAVDAIRVAIQSVKTKIVEKEVEYEDNDDNDLNEGPGTNPWDQSDEETIPTPKTSPPESDRTDESHKTDLNHTLVDEEADHKRGEEDERRSGVSPAQDVDEGGETHDEVEQPASPAQGSDSHTTEPHATREDQSSPEEEAQPTYSGETFENEGLHQSDHTK